MPIKDKEPAVEDLIEVVEHNVEANVEQYVAAVVCPRVVSTVQISEERNLPASSHPTLTGQQLPTRRKRPTVKERTDLPHNSTRPPRSPTDNLDR